MTRGRAAQALAASIIGAVDDNEERIKGVFTLVGLLWTSYEGDARNRLQQAIRSSDLTKIRELVNEVATQHSDYRRELEERLVQFEEAHEEGPDPEDPRQWHGRIQTSRLLQIAAGLLFLVTLAAVFKPSGNPPVPAPRERQLLTGTLMTLDSTAPLNDLYTARPTTGKESLIKSLTPMSLNGWFGYVFLTNPLPGTFEKPELDIEILDAAGNVIHNTTDLVDVHWLAPDKSHEREERDEGGQRLDQEGLHYQHSGTVHEGSYLVVVYRYRDFRVVQPQIHVFIH